MNTQAMEALGLARQTRTERAIIKRQLAGGELSLDEAVSAECCWSMPLWKLLDVLPWWGRARAKRVLAPVGLDADAQVGSLTDRERHLLVLAYRREMAHMSNGRRGRRA